MSILPSFVSGFRARRCVFFAKFHVYTWPRTPQNTVSTVEDRGISCTKDFFSCHAHPHLSPDRHLCLCSAVSAHRNGDNKRYQCGRRKRRSKEVRILPSISEAHPVLVRIARAFCGLHATANAEESATDAFQA